MHSAGPGIGRGPQEQCLGQDGPLTWLVQTDPTGASQQPSILIHFFVCFVLFYFMCVSAHMLSAMFVPGTRRGQKRASDMIERELQMVGSYHVGVRN